MAFARSLVTAVLVAGALVGRAAPAQIVEVRPVTPTAAGPSIDVLRGLQDGFESFRRQKLPHWTDTGPSGNGCDEIIGRFCYWYNERQADPPEEPGVIAEARARLLAQLDSAGRAFPNDRWVSGQRVRYLSEHGRLEDAVAAAKECTARDWWCSAIRGFALHMAGRYAESDSAWELALGLMSRRERCEWRDLKLIVDDALLRKYREHPCEGRVALERRIWWLSRPMLSAPGNDARTEYYSRKMMALFLEDAPSVYQMAFDSDERELLLRYGWPRAWARDGRAQVGAGASYPVVGFEPSPAHPFIPAPGVLENPASSDSAGWRSKGIPPVRARYAPEYARRLLPLEHQSALFRRGDTALVVVAWSVATDSALEAAAKAGQLTAALALTRGEEGDASVARAGRPDTKGTLSAKMPWGSMLMSVEVGAPSRRTLARARYGVRGTEMPGSRVQMSDVLLFEPYDGMPMNLDEVTPRMLTSQRIPEGSRVGIYWEAYNTNPAGEGIGVSITVAPEAQEGGWLRRSLQALRRVREAKPVTVGMRDVSARGATLSPRSVVVDLSSLTPGRYLMQLELDAGGGNVVRSEKAITVVRRL
jgi:hypothetical protein